MFINALNEQATVYGGKIVKLLGNHDLAAIIYPPIYQHNIYDKDIQLDNYYKNDKRIDIFKVGKPGFNLLVEGGIGILVKINSTIFVHGDLVETYDTYDDLNQFINNPNNQNETMWEEKLWSQLNKTSSLLSLKRGDDDVSTERAKLRVDGNYKSSNEFCMGLQRSFEHFVGDRTIITDNVDNLKLVIGHCTQYSISSLNGQGVNETYSEKIYEDNIKETFGETIYTGSVMFDRTDNRTKIFGITMECQIPKSIHRLHPLHRLYRVDVGLSRGFDDGYLHYPLSLENENRFLYSKTPQILEINIDGPINIIKSKMRNTRIHLQRPEYERMASKIPELLLYTKDHNYYEQKYLKYKNKYLQLKQMIN